MADKKIIDLTSIVLQDTTDIYEVSKNGMGSFKESRSQMQSFFNGFYLIKSNNLDDLPSRVAALDNLGIPVGYQTVLLTENYMFTNPPDFANFFTPNASTWTVFLPTANDANSIEIGHGLIITNDSSTQYFTLKSNDGTDTYVQVNPGEAYYIYLVDDSTANGTWVVYPVNYLINNNTSGEAINVLSTKNACRVATTENLNATYFAGSGNGFGATLTNAGAMVALSIDGISLSLNDRVLVKDQTNKAHNGLYKVVNVGSGATNWVIQRSFDYYSVIENNALGMISPGDIVSISSGTTNGSSFFIQTNSLTTIGTDPISFDKLSTLQKVRQITGNYTLTPNDHLTVFAANPSSSEITVTVPAGSTLFKGFTFTVKHTGNDETDRIKVLASSSNQVDYFDYAIVSLNQSATFVLEDGTNTANISSVATSGFGQDFHLVYNVNIDTYTLQDKDNGAFIFFPATGTTKTLTIPANASVNLKKGFWCKVYNPGSANVNISSTDDIEGTTIIRPGMTVVIIKRIYGSPNTWSISGQYGINVYGNNLYSIQSSGNMEIGGMGMGSILMLNQTAVTGTLFVDSVSEKTSDEGTTITNLRIPWTTVTGTSDQMLLNQGYTSNNAGLVTLTLPATARVGDMVIVHGLGAGGWRIAQNAGQLIHLGSSTTTTGAGGRLDSTNQYDSVTLRCTVTNTTWNAQSIVGNITVT